jgi:hypothetical protein
MAKIINEGSAKPGDPIFQQGWTLYMGPQPKKPAETPSQDTSPKKSEAVENQDVEVEKMEE